MRITSQQYRTIKNRRSLSKEDQARLEKGLDPIEDEDTAQMKLVRYLEMIMDETGRIVKFTAIPNHTRTPYKSVRAKNTLLGVRAGLCDLLIGYKPKQGGKPRLLFLEMKREKGGTLSKEQKGWIAFLSVCEAITATHANGFEEAKRIVDDLIF